MLGASFDLARAQHVRLGMNPPVVVMMMRVRSEHETFSLTQPIVECQTADGEACGPPRSASPQVSTTLPTFARD